MTIENDILVVDDEITNLQLLAGMLEKEGYRVRPAERAQTALDSALAKPPDLILLDIRMPGMDGYEVCRRLKEDQHTRDIPVIFISALDEAMDKVKAFELGGVDYITKPFQSEEVLTRVKNHLSLRQMQARLEHQNTQLQQANVKMKREIDARKQVEEALREKTHNLGERVKELNCLYNIANLDATPDIKLKEIFQGVVEIIQPSWQYPEITCSRIILEGQEYKTKNFMTSDWKQVADIVIRDQRIGYLEVYYLEEKPKIDEGPFLKEERALINAIAERLGRIIERKHGEDKIKASLKEKEVLLREIHHRVKNNMQLIISLLRLQANKIEDKKYADMFKDGEDRIRSMSLIHEKLYQTQDFANINFGEHIESLVDGLFVSYGVDTNKISLNIDIKDVSIDLENAIPCGLIINELVSNSLKYAFPQKREGKISITLRPFNEDELELTVSDDGVGISEDLDIEQTDTMGLYLVKLLAEHQLDGQIELNRPEGTLFRIKFKGTD